MAVCLNRQCVAIPLAFNYNGGSTVFMSTKGGWQWWRRVIVERVKIRKLVVGGCGGQQPLKPNLQLLANQHTRID